MGESSPILHTRHATLCLIMMLVKIVKCALVLLFCCAMAKDETSSEGRVALAKAYEAIADDAAVEVIDPDNQYSDIVFDHRFEMIQKLNDDEDETAEQGLNAVVEEVTSKKDGHKTSKKMLKSMKHRVKRWKKRANNAKKKKWTPAQIRDSKRAAKAADKAHTAEIVSDYVAKKAAKEERLRRGAALEIWAKEKLQKAKHKHLSKKKKKAKKKKTKMAMDLELIAETAKKEARDAYAAADAYATGAPIKGGTDPDA